MQGNSIAELHRGQHACLLYDQGSEAVTAVAPFLAAGLAAGERCVYVLGDHSAEDVEAALAAAGVDAAGDRRRGALVLVDRWQVSFPDGRFDPAAMIVYVRSGIADSQAAGFSGLRVVAEMSWALQMGVEDHRLIHYEALGNDLYPDQPLVSVCLYDRSKFPAAVCQDALRVHPVVAVDGCAYPNLYFDLPEALADGAGAGERVEWMMGQLRRLAEADRERAELLEAQAAHQEAEAAVRARDELLATLAHELRTPLGAMLAQVQASLVSIGRNGHQGDGRLRSSLEMIGRQAKKQAKLIEQVMAAAQTSSGDLPVELEPCDLAALAEDAVEAARATSPDHTFSLGVRACPPLRADPVRLEQVLTNLLDNAAKFSPPGSRVEVEIGTEDGRALLAVRDHGAGVPPERREQIFERYQRGEGSSGGLGLGLYVSREIVRRHGGELVVEPAPGGGSRFVARLPLSS